MGKALIYEITGLSVQLLKSNPPKLLVQASGITTTLGWRNPALKLREIELTPDGVLDLNFVAKPPEEGSGDVFDEITADFLWEQDAEKVRAVIVYGRKNKIAKQVGEMPPIPPLPGLWPPTPAPYPPGPGPSPLPPGVDPRLAGVADIAARSNWTPGGGLEGGGVPHYLDPLDLGIILGVCRWATQSAYAEIRGFGIHDGVSPSLPTLHSNPGNWISFFRGQIEPRINSFDLRYALANHTRELLTQLYPRTFHDVYYALAANIQKANR